MRNRIVPPHVPDRLKSEVKRSVNPVKTEERGKGVCLYVTGENRAALREPRGQRMHVIPESEVLDELKDRKSDKVFDCGGARLDGNITTRGAARLIQSHEQFGCVRTTTRGA